MKTLIKGKEFNVKQTGNRFFYWSPRATRWLPVKRSLVLFSQNEMPRQHALSHAETLAEARAMRSNGGAHARLLRMASFYRQYFAQARALLRAQEA